MPPPHHPTAGSPTDRSDGGGERAARPADLARPESYPGLETSRVDVIETHVSHLFLTEQRVFKLKKPIALPFVDQSTRALRRAGCEAELRLNRRLSPHMYLGLRDVVRGTDGVDRVAVVEPCAGDVVDTVVDMVRLPAEGMLDARLARDDLDASDLRAVSALLADFHARADGSPAIAAHGTPERVRAKILENVDQLAEQARPHVDAFADRRVEALRDGLVAACDRHAALLAARHANGRIREGHGDLHAGNVCIADGRVSIYDCVEFDLDLRADDVACDLAFLVMDLEHRGHADAARRVVQDYAEEARDVELAQLMPLYGAHRAAIRAKVALFAAHQHDDELASKSVDEAARYLALALDLLARDAG